MNAFFAWALARLSEPSTYAGFSALAATATFLPQADLDLTTKMIGAAAIAIPALVAVIAAEGASAPAAPLSGK